MMAKYNITNMTTGEIIETVDELPSNIPNGYFPVEVTVKILDRLIDEVNNAASSEILKGYEYNGILFTLSEMEQLNYNSIANFVNMSGSDIVIYGETENDKYYKVDMTASEASSFFLGLFGYVDGILSKYRDVKKLLLSAVEEDYEQIMIDAGLRDASEA
jgi:hypothetical protein